MGRLGYPRDPPGQGERSTHCELTRSRWWLQVVAAAAVLAYAISTVAVHRPPDGYNSLWDGWLYSIAELLPLVPIGVRVHYSPRLRSAWAAIGGGVLLNAAGDLVYLFYVQNLKPVPYPAVSDAIYLASYASFIVGVALLTQSSFGPVHASVRLDGAIAGLALSAVAGMLWFGSLLRVSGRPLVVVVGMAYPLSDLLLLVLLVAGLAPHRYRPNWPTVTLMAGVLWFVIGDVVYLNQTASSTYRAGTPLQATWLVGLFFMGLAASWNDRRHQRGRRSNVVTPSGITLVPVVFGLLSLAVLVASLFRHDAPAVSAMAIAALGLVIARMALTLREVRQSAANYQDARTDYLTGLPNRRGFLEHVEATYLSPKRPGLHQVGVLLVDLDGFKEVNDALGHAAGDELLCIVAKRFAGRLAHRGLLGRLGGDEYACAVPLGTESDLTAIAQELARSLADPCVVDGTSVRVGASIGVALPGNEGTTAGELLRCADVAMYAAKRAQSSVVVYRSATDPNSRERLALIDELRAAIENRDLVLHYQPTLDMRTGTVRGAEALARWEHPTRGLLYPDDFIPLAERNGLMPQLTRAVLDLAVAEAARLERAGHPLQMNVNISRYDLVDEELPGYIDEVLARHAFPHGRLTLEITESAFGGDPQRAERCVLELRARGLRVAIDDFGVGYSSMSQLLGLEIDELKIDKSFVIGLTSDIRAQAIVRSAVELARALDVTVVAEGIEGEDVLQLLQGIGADIGQGYVIARPLPPEKLEDYLDQPELAACLLAEATTMWAGGAATVVAR